MRHWKRFTAMLLVLTILLSSTSCAMIQSLLMPDWDDLTKELFITSMQADTLSMHFYINEPSAFGIDDYEETLGSLEYDEGNTWASDALELIERYDREDLTEEQQYEYEILHWYLSTETMGEGYDYYMELAAPTYGIQANYPINMADYAIDSTEDIDHYFELIEDTPRYFDELLMYETERAEAGFCMTDSQLDRMLDDCEDFIDVSITENVMITSFAERVDALEIAEEQEQQYLKDHQKLVEEHVIPAYEEFMEGMEKLKGSCSGTGSIAEYPEGKAYYEYLARSNSSSNRSVEDMKELLKTYIQRHMYEMYEILNANNDLIVQMENPSYGAEDPAAILEMISKRMEQLVPKVEAQYSVRYVPESLQESLPPAFCYIPQIDNVESVIYINQNPEYENMDFYTTVAHEGYPGHMYQNTYFYNTEPSWFRYILPYLGYREGWACYISYKALGLSEIENEELVRLLMLNEALGYELSGLADIGVNYDGWTLEELQSFFEQYGYALTEKEAEEQYNMLLDSPAGYLSYSVSCCEFWELESYAQMKLKDDYDEKEFHRVILDAGPASFSMLKEQLDVYIQNTK